MGKTVRIDCTRISDWSSLHDEFARAFGFPAFYGRNSEAWIDCMTNLDTDFSTVQVSPGETVALELEAARTLKDRSPNLLMDILELSAFVNFRRVENCEQPILCVSGNI